MTADKTEDKKPSAEEQLQAENAQLRAYIRKNRTDREVLEGIESSLVNSLGAIAGQINALTAKLDSMGKGLANALEEDKKKG